MRARREIKGKFLVPYEYRYSAAFAGRPAAARAYPANIELGLNRSFSLFFNEPSTNPI
jgi:hypothetical protein